MKRNVIITGASGGIGAAMAKVFAGAGDNVIVNYNNNGQAAEKVVSEILEQGGNASAVQSDLSIFDNAEKLVEKARQIYGPVDILINNVGISNFKLFNDIDEQEWNRMISTNLMSAIACSKAVLSDMIASKNGIIINISSIWGMVGASCEVHYSTTKAALIGFTKALAKELGPSNIRVNCIAPGVIDTEMNAGLDSETIEELEKETPLGRMGSVEEIAKTALFLASEDSAFITGQVISPNGGFVI